MKKNVIFILTDDQRYNTIHALGNPEIHTPNLDWLAENGTVFEQAHIPGGTNGAICMPSRAMLNSGRSLFHLEAEGGNIPESDITLAEVFRRDGYDCYGTGKWHNGCPAFTRGFTGGENVFFGGMWDHWNVPVSHYDPTGEYDNVINFVADFFHTGETIQVHCDEFHPGVHSTELLTNTALDYLENRPQDRPFYLYLAYLAPHDPRTMPQRFKELYDPEKLTLPENFMERHPFEVGVEDIRDEILLPTPRTEEAVRRELADYCAMISHLDYEIGRLLQSLREKNLLEDTVLVFTGDNGLAVGCHGMLGKQNLYDHSVRVPLVFAGAGIPKNKKVENYVYLMDIYPTLCELTGHEVPDTVEGKSFAAMFGDGSVKTRETLYLAYRDLMRGVKDSRYKLIEYRGPVRRTQLFDLKEDPAELRDLSACPEQQENLARLRALLERYRDQWEDLPSEISETFWSRY